MAEQQVRSNVGCPKNFSQPWSSGIKKVYITAETCVKFRQVKKGNGFASDDYTLQYLLNCNEKRCSSLRSYAAPVFGATLLQSSELRCSSPQCDCRPEFLRIVQPF